MFILSQIQSLVYQGYYDCMFKLDSKIKNSLLGLIYAKSLVLSNKARKSCTNGQMLNLMAVDVQSLNEFPHHLNSIWSCILNIFICITILAVKLNATTAFATFLTMILFLPLNSLISNKSKTLQTEKSKLQDKRIKTIDEVLNGIKVFKEPYLQIVLINRITNFFNSKIIKLMNWEASFKSIISKIRLRELKILKKFSYLNSVSAFNWTLAPFIVFNR